MAVNAVVKNGEIMETASQSSVSQAASSAPDGYSKDAFLQLLVAQMKYQDPLEPTSNTEYISQYATFSQVEQLQNMASSMDLGRASSMVGQTVQITTTDAKGNAKELEGVVEYVKYENAKAYVSVDGTLYAANDVTAIIDDAYNTAYKLAESFASAVNELPSIANLTLADQDTIKTLATGYNALSSYQQSFIDKSYVDLLEEYVAVMDKMISDSENSKNATEGDKSTEEEKVSEEAIDALLADE